jgi:hypothetical protein
MGSDLVIIRGDRIVYNGTMVHEGETKNVQVKQTSEGLYLTYANTDETKFFPNRRKDDAIWLGTIIAFVGFVFWWMLR